MDETILDKLAKQQEEAHISQLQEIKAITDQLYTQLESLSWLQRALAISGSLPPLRGWPVSPDFLLYLHTWIRRHRPLVVVETGSGASTLVIADALRQNGVGKLFSFEHLRKYADQTLEMLRNENLSAWADIRLGALEPWHGDHLNSKESKKPSRWYPVTLKGINNVELLVVDGPPGSICPFSRYPALPAFADVLAPHAEVWMDDTNRKEEQVICEHWAKKHSLKLEYLPFEKGMCRLSSVNSPPKMGCVPITAEGTNESILGLDFSLPELKYK